MKSKYIIISIALFLSAALIAQDQSHAFRYSQNFMTGTARFNAMGGAFGAVGGDFTSASGNPAGLGLYRNSEFTFTPSYQLINAESNYNGTISKDQATNLNIGNIGIVTPVETGRESGLISTTLAFGYNGLSNYKSNLMMQTVQESSSMGTSLLDNFAWYANNNNELDPFYEELAFQTALMPLDTAAGEYWHYLEPFDDINYNGYGQEQIRIVEKNGYKGEYTFSAAMNLNHQLYVGATMGIQVVRYNEDIHHEEADFDDLEPDFRSFTFGEYNSTRGYGVGFKIGLIYKPIHILRLGAAFHGPTVYQLTDDKFTDLTTEWDANSGLINGYESSGLFSKEYTLRTPYRASASAAVLIGSFGLISAEYEYVDYSTADLNSPGYKFIDENIMISRDFTAAHNFKTGLEVRLNPVYLRGGFQYYMNPFADKQNGSDILVYSGGIGFRSNQTFVDISYSLSTRSDLYGLYVYDPDSGGTDISMNSYTRSNIMVTLGYNF